MIIGVISDTHGLLRPEALDALQGSELIIHAGDVGAPEILDELAKIAPVHAICGNIDVEPWARKLPETMVVTAGDSQLFVIHDRKQLKLDAKILGYAAVISGHSHKPLIETKNGVLYFNPGSAGPRRFKLPISIGQLVIEGGEIRPRIIELQC